MKVEFCYGVFFSQFIAKANFTITPSGVHRLPTLSRTFSSADALSHAWARQGLRLNVHTLFTQLY